MAATDNREGSGYMLQDAQCTGDAEATQDESREQCDCATPDECHKEGNGSAEGEKMTALKEEPYPKTVTGVIRIMHATGRKSEAEFWEELHETERQAERLLKSLQQLHRKRTGYRPRVPKGQPPHANDE